MKHVDPRLLSGTALRAPERKEDDDDAILKDVKKTVDSFMSAFEEFKSTNEQRIKEIEKKGVATPETLDKLAKIEKSLEAGEALSAKYTKLEAETKAAKEAAEEREKEADELKSRFDEMEQKLNRPRRGSGDDATEKKAAFNAWARGVVNAITLGVQNLPEDQQKMLADVRAEHKALSVNPDTAGGYLSPMDYVLEIIKGVTEISPVRQLVRVRQTINKSVQIPKRTGQFAAQWVSEQGTRSETTGLAYGLEEIPLHELYALIDISNQQLEDSAFDMEMEIREESSEQFALAEGTAVVSGNGVGKPEGWMTNSDVATTVSGAATTVEADGMLTLKHAIKTAYARNASWALNRTTMGSVRKLKDGGGQYLWMPGIAMGKPNTIDGDPYVEVPDMPNEGAGLKPIAYGDFRRAYTMIDRIVMEMLRDPYTQATSGNVRFIFRRRLGGQVTLAEAIRTLTCST